MNSLQQAQQEVLELKSAQARLTQRARDIFDEMKNAAAAVDAALIKGEKIALKGLSDLEFEYKAVSRANSRVIEQLLPLAEIAEMERTAEHLSARAYALREESAGRLQKTAQLMAEAAEFEGGIVFDSENTLSGKMQAEADELERQAANYRTWARGREEQHLRLARELESMRIL